MKLKIWNLVVLEHRLYNERKSGDAFIIRQVLDLISSNWRSAIDMNELKINLRIKRDIIK